MFQRFLGEEKLFDSQKRSWRKRTLRLRHPTNMSSNGFTFPLAFSEQTQYVNEAGAFLYLILTKMALMFPSVWQTSRQASFWPGLLTSPSLEHLLKKTFDYKFFLCPSEMWIFSHPLYPLSLSRTWETTLWNVIIRKDISSHSLWETRRLV